MSNILDTAIQTVKDARISFCRFITGNDAGVTGSHQAGFYVPKCAAPLLFGEECRKGENKEKWVTIKWQNEIETDSRFIYYGRGTRNEYRITRFGHGFEFLLDKYVGSLLIITKQSDTYYQAYVLESDDDIDSFLSYFRLSAEQTNQLINASNALDPNELIDAAILKTIEELADFPQTQEMAKIARTIFNQVYHVTESDICIQPDKIIFDWRDVESRLFFSLEDKIYRKIYTHPFPSCDELMNFANSILNRRKSRAGKSLEHHLSAIFKSNSLIFEEQVVTENNKKPDFLFPGSECYHNFEFPADDLTVLGAKTTCKDRWRQILNEADRVEEKFLCTLQPGISRTQLQEMEDSHVRLVVPQSIIPSYPIEFQTKICSLAWFINLVKEKQSRIHRQYLVNASE